MRKRIIVVATSLVLAIGLAIGACGGQGKALSPDDQRIAQAAATAQAAVDDYGKHVKDGNYPTSFMPAAFTDIQVAVATHKDFHTDLSKDSKTKPSPIFAAGTIVYLDMMQLQMEKDLGGVNEEHYYELLSDIYQLDQMCKKLAK